MTPETAPLLVAYDGSDASKHAIQQVAASFPGRSAVVLQVVETAVLAGLEHLEALTSHRAEIAQEVIDEINRMVETQATESAGEGAVLAKAAGLNAEPRVEFYRHRNVQASAGEVAHTIIAIGDELDAATIVLSTGGLVSPTGPLRLGSVAYRVLHDADRPVLLVPRPRG